MKNSTEGGSAYLLKQNKVVVKSDLKRMVENGSRAH